MADLSVHAGKRHGTDGVPRGCRSCGRGMFRSYHQSDCHVFGKTAPRTLLPHPFRSVENDGQTVCFHGGSAYHQPGDDSSFQQPGESSDPAKTSGIWLQCFGCPEYFWYPDRYDHVHHSVSLCTDQFLFRPFTSGCLGSPQCTQPRTDCTSDKKAILYGLLLGFAFTILFLVFGDRMGDVLFHNTLAGNFICQLSWLCPLLYVTSLLNSILHGLGNARQVLFVTLLACMIRICMILFLVPQYGIDAYLWGMLLSYVFAAIADILLLMPYSRA